MKLRTQISCGFALIVLITAALISLVSNLLINRQFEKYVAGRQAAFADGLAAGLCDQYDADSGSWNLEYIHGFGMYALKDGYIIKVYGKDHSLVWDAENHDATYCHQMMGEIKSKLMEQKTDGKLETVNYDLSRDGAVIGYADISYYMPCCLSTDEFQFMHALNRILPGVCLVSMLGAVLLGSLYSRRIVRPVSKTIATAKEIAKGNYRIRCRVAGGTEELAELTESVNQLAETLEAQENIRKRLTADIAHELRTPVANVSSHLEAIIDGVWEPTEKRLERCYRELGRISDLISDLETLSRIETENMRLSVDQVDLKHLAAGIRTAFEKVLEEKAINCEIEGENAVIPGDEKRLSQVIYNLLSNAIKFSPEHSEIVIETHTVENGAELTVKDQGIGIPGDELSLIFERFYRADRSRNRKTGGSGIGLAIVKAIVLAHGGNVRAESEPGKGSIFTVYLPALPAEKGNGKPA